MTTKVTFTLTERKRIYILRELEARRLTAREAAEQLGLTLRHVWRLLRRYRQEGEVGLAHGNRGQPSPKRLAERARAKILKLAQTEYADYNDCHLTEKLNRAPYALNVSRSTVRRVRRAAGLGSPRNRRAPQHRQRRERRPRAGMLLQADASRHAWLEDRGPELSLIAYIDDATSQVVWGHFQEAEDAAGYVLGLRDICLTRGIPQALYVDRHSIFRPTKPTPEDKLLDEPLLSQFGRILQELWIELILAQSPQAKGRIERLWGTLQDRLVKALREAKAATLAQANAVLAQFLPQHNARFAAAPAELEEAYIPWLPATPPDAYFCFKHQRRVANDNTISFGGYRLQLPPTPLRATFAHVLVDVQQQLDGRLVILYQQQPVVVFQSASQAPLRVEQFDPPPEALRAPAPPPPPPAAKPATPRPPVHPAMDHPWRAPLTAKAAAKRKDEKKQR
jgi:transposase